jgi:NitT/TauT family transport system permease protein
MSDKPIMIFGIFNRERFLKNMNQTVLGIAAIVTFIVAWWGLSVYLQLAFLPSPDKVFWAFFNSFEKTEISLGTNMWGNIIASLQRFGIGFVFALGLALPIGLIMGFIKTADSFFKPLVELFRPIPPVAWVPIFLLIFGIFWGPVMVIFLGVFFPLLSNIIFGVKSVDQPLIDAARTMGANRYTLFKKVIFPYTIPFIMTGITIGLGIGWMCIVAAEMIGAVGGGVGYYILYSESIGRYEFMFAGMAVIAILGIGTVGVSHYVENKLNRRMGVK